MGMIFDIGLLFSNVVIFLFMFYLLLEMDDCKMEEKDWRCKGLGGGRLGVVRERRVE